MFNKVNWTQIKFFVLVLVIELEDSQIPSHFWKFMIVSLKAIKKHTGYKETNLYWSHLKQWAMAEMKLFCFYQTLMDAESADFLFHF